MEHYQASGPCLRKVAVVGAGVLGIRIAGFWGALLTGKPSSATGELALLGCTVHVYDRSPLTLQTLHSSISQQLQELRQSDLLQPDQQMKGCVIAESLLSGAVTDAEIVIECATEDVAVKNSLFRDIASVCSSGTILCSSTLTLDLSDVFADVPHPERTLGVRFLFPVYLIDIVEETFYKDTSDGTISQVQQFLKSLQKSPFSRMPGEFPRKLTKEEAFDLQKSACKQQTTW